VRSLFRRKPLGVRIAALQALAEARTPEAMDGLRALMQDKDADVREAAGYALRRIGRER
jgi:HEAT repeat protein